MRMDQSLEPLRGYLPHAHARDLSPLDSMLYMDTKTWLPDDLLLKADKMTMANSLELRVPFLDHKVLEFAAGLPSDWKVRWFTTKFIAKRALAGRVPREIVDRRKAGFPVPYEHWIQNELHGWFRDLLLDSRTVNRGYFRRRRRGPPGCQPSVGRLRQGNFLAGDFGIVASRVS